jgi:hypothetical protein
MNLSPARMKKQTYLKNNLICHELQTAAYVGMIDVSCIAIESNITEEHSTAGKPATLD